MSTLPIHWPKWKDSEIELPDSKSWRNRQYIIQGLCGQDLTEPSAHQADDAHRMYQALSSNENIINAGSAGTAFRFLTAYFVIKAIETGTSYRLDGSAQMRKRPIGALVDALRLLGAKIDYLGNSGFPPLNIHPAAVSGKKIHWSNRESSQFLSALMLIAPYMNEGMDIRWSGSLPSFSYIELTAEIMQKHGADVALGENQISVSPTPYDRNMHVRPQGDWSSAAFWLSALMLRGKGAITLNGLHLGTHQGDEALIHLFKKWGLQVTDTQNGIRAVLLETDLPERIRLNLNEAPDLVPALSALAVGLKIPGHIEGIGHLRFKESNRLEALKIELQKWGAQVEITENGMKWGAFSPPNEEIIHHSYDDHRMAMAFAPLSQLQAIKIKDPEVVAKSYPGFWEDAVKLGLSIL